MSRCADFESRGGRLGGQMVVSYDPANVGLAAALGKAGLAGRIECKAESAAEFERTAATAWNVLEPVGGCAGVGASGGGEGSVPTHRPQRLHLHHLCLPPPRLRHRGSVR